MGVRKSLSNPDDLAEIIIRLNSLSENSPRKWGRMTVAQMLKHCEKTLHVGMGKIVLPKTPYVIRLIGICAKKEIRLFDNGIPRNMPTYKALKLKESCKFEEAKESFLISLNEFLVALNENTLIPHHQLFGKMNNEDWGFLQYKHLDHHLKQFET